MSILQTYLKITFSTNKYVIFVKQFEENNCYFKGLFESIDWIIH